MGRLLNYEMATSRKTQFRYLKIRRNTTISHPQPEVRNSTRPHSPQGLRQKSITYTGDCADLLQNKHTRGTMQPSCPEPMSMSCYFNKFQESHMRNYHRKLERLNLRNTVKNHTIQILNHFFLYEIKSFKLVPIKHSVGELSP